MYVWDGDEDYPVDKCYSYEHLIISPVVSESQASSEIKGYSKFLSTEDQQNTIVNPITDPLASFWVSRQISKTIKDKVKIAFIQDDLHHKEILNFI